MVELIREENEYFIPWIKKIWKHHDTVDFFYQCDFNAEIVFEKSEVYYKIMKNNIMVGFVGLKFRDDKILNSHTLYISRFYIDEKYRNLGIGTEAMEQLVGIANEMGRDIELDVYGDNPAIHLYEKMGFKVNFRNMILKVVDKN